MNSQLHLSDSAEGVVTRPAEHIGLKGRFIFKLERDGKVIDEWESPNLVTNIGRNTVLNTAIGGASQIAIWYIGLIDNAGFSALAAGDTMASHAGWVENASYSNVNRPTYSPAAASSQSITNAASVATFNISGTATINGAFITSNNTISGASGTLLCEASFGSTRSVISGDTLAVTYVLND